MKGLKELLEKRWFANTFAICAGVLFFVLLNNLPAIGKAFGWISAILMPVATGVIIAYLLDPIVSFIEKKIFRGETGDGPIRVVSVILGFLVVALSLSGIIVLLVPSVTASIEKILSNIPAYQISINKIFNWLNSFLGQDIETIWDYVNKGFLAVEEYVKRNAIKILSASLSAGGVLFNFIIGVIISFYFLVGKKNMLEGIAKLRKASTSEKSYQSQTKFLLRCHKILISFIGYDLLDAIIIGIVNAILMVVFKMPFIPLVSVVVAIANLIPTFGPFIGAGIGGVVLLFSNPIHSIIFLIYTLIIQILDGYVLKPKLFGSVLGVAPVWVLITLVVGGNLFGPIGILLAIPFAAIFTFVYNEAILPALESGRDKRAKNREEKKKKDQPFNPLD